MRPVKTADANFVYRGPTDEIGDLWVERGVAHGEDGSYRFVTSVFELDEDELDLIKAGGRISLTLYVEPIPPIALSVVAKEDSEPVGEHGWKGQQL